MVLIAAVAASVLINTSETLQSRAKTVGTSTIREVSAGIAIEQVTGYTNEEKSLIEYLSLQVRPRAGSKDIDLSLCTLSVLHNNLSMLKLNESLVQDVNVDNKSVFHTPIISGSPYTIVGNTSQLEFGVIAVHDPDGSITTTNGMNSGDRALLIINLSAILDTGGLEPRKDVSGVLAPEIGIKAEYDVTAPSVFSMRIVKLD
jgi:flagellin FlaB